MKHINRYLDDYHRNDCGNPQLQIAYEIACLREVLANSKTDGDKIRELEEKLEKTENAARYWQMEARDNARKFSTLIRAIEEAAEDEDSSVIKEDIMGIYDHLRRKEK